MKFHQLPVGARFRFRDTDYRKISPLKGVNETDGTQRLVPRSAEVRRLDDVLAAPEFPSRLSGEAVDKAVRKMAEDCKRALPRVDPALTPDQQAQVIAALDSAIQEMLATLAAR